MIIRNNQSILSIRAVRVPSLPRTPCILRSLKGDATANVQTPIMARCETAAALMLLLCCLSVWLPMPRTVEWRTSRAAVVQSSLSPLVGTDEGGESLPSPRSRSRWPPPAPTPAAPSGRTQPKQPKQRKGRKGKEGGCDVRCESAT